MNFNAQLPRPDFSCFTTTHPQPHEKRERTRPTAIQPQDDLLDESPTKRLRQRDKNSVDDISGSMGGVFLSPTKKEASQARQIAQLADQISKLIRLPGYETNAIADAIIFAFSPKEVEGTYFEPKDNIVPRSILYNFDAREAYVDLEQPLNQAAYPGSRLALQVTVPANKAETTTVKKFQLTPCANRPFEKRVLAKSEYLNGAYIPCEAYFTPSEKIAIPTRYALFPLLNRRFDAYHGQAQLPNDIVAITHRALEALAKLHAVGVVHGNICLNSIHIDDSGCVKLTDFSHASLIAALPGQLYGTPKHTAPEFFRDGVLADTQKTAQDVYAFGKVIREVLTDEILPWEPKIQELQQLLRKYAVMKETANEDTELDLELISQIGNLKDAIVQEQRKADREAIEAEQALITSKKNTLYDDNILSLVCLAAIHSIPNKRPTAKKLADLVFKFIK